jgi:outer membrane lipoprotein-sorting protein
MLKRRKTLTRTSASFFVAFLLLVAIGCAQNQKVTTETNANESIVSSTPPFQTKEPERYRATRTITTVTANGATTVTKDRVARNGEWRRDEPDIAARRMIFLYGPDGNFLLLPETKTFVELTKVGQPKTPGAENESDTSPDRLLHTVPITTTYQKIGAETINGRTTQKYRAVVNSPTDTNVTANETLIWVDEALQMPIRSETKSSDGKRVTTELTDISLEVEPALFRVPDGYQKITRKELDESWKKLSEIQGKPR